MEIVQTIGANVTMSVLHRKDNGNATFVATLKGIADQAPVMDTFLEIALAEVAEIANFDAHA